jgi:TonB family protein
MTYNKLGDSCNSCKDLRIAAYINEKEFGKLFEQKCSFTTLVQNVPDNIKILYPEINKLKITSYKCDSDTLLVGIIGEEPNASEIEIRSLGNSSAKTPNNEVYTIVEQMPLYPGGDNERNRLLATNIVYPELATKNGIQGTVYVQFVIDTEGSVTNVKVLQGIGGGCDEESVRVVNLMPKWNPGKQKGKAVNVLFNMPIYFRLGR